MKVIGLISGTSVDGIDTALVEIEGRDLQLKVKLLAGEIYPYPPALKEKILAVCAGKSLSIAELANLDESIAIEFASAAQKIQPELTTAELIGSHGQTVYHRPPIKKDHKNASSTNKLGFSWQMGRGELIAAITKIPTVNNFRAADIAAGGEGAPLVSKVDACLLSHPTEYRAIQNLGGIGNVTYLPPNRELDWERQISGWDTGPANALIDLAVQQLTNGRQTYDINGDWAASGTANLELVERWLQQDYFRQLPPKSTGKELFGTDYLAQCWQDARQFDLSNSDWLATLTELTVASIVDSYRRFLPKIPDRIFLCGGGSHNRYLRQSLKAKLTSAKIGTTDEVGINGDFKEAIAFAVLAYWRFVSHFPGNLPQVTGAKQPMLLGDIHLPRSF
jgi:anhydro-N-acetylmuramic acid kinase